MHIEKKKKKKRLMFILVYLPNNIETVPIQMPRIYNI